MKMLSIAQINTIKKSWSKDTCYPPDRDKWSEQNPAIGQCAVTALLVQDIIGGVILFSRKNNHYWNRMDDGSELDLTREQFLYEIDRSDTVVIDREKLFDSEKAETRKRYELLKNHSQLS